MRHSNVSKLLLYMCQVCALQVNVSTLWNKQVYTVDTYSPHISNHHLYPPNTTCHCTIFSEALCNLSIPWNSLLFPVVFPKFQCESSNKSGIDIFIENTHFHFSRENDRPLTVIFLMPLLKHFDKI